MNLIIVNQFISPQLPSAWFLTIWRASPILPREASRRREFGLFRLVSENSGFAHVRHIIIINHGYLVNIDKLLYYNTVVALSIGYNATSANMRRKTLVSEEEVLEKSSTSEEKILI